MPSVSLSTTALAVWADARLTDPSASDEERAVFVAAGHRDGGVDVWRGRMVRGWFFG
jgi:hypothetical protein